MSNKKILLLACDLFMKGVKRGRGKRRRRRRRGGSRRSGDTQRTHS
jgi:hypothetical protein